MTCWPVRKALGPALVTLACMAGLVLVTLFYYHGDPMALVRQGTRFSGHVPNGTWGYDGQFYYAIAVDPTPASFAQVADLPAYRYQRILFPLLARTVCLGNLDCLPWVFPLLGVFFQGLGTWLVGRLLIKWGVNPWFALIFGLWFGFVYAVRLDLPETMAFALAAGALLAMENDHTQAAALLFGLGLFAKEVTAAFWLAAVLHLAVRRQWRRVVLVGLLPGIAFAAFQLWLLAVFGRVGLASGGALATPFVIVPYLGLLGALIEPSFPVIYRLTLLILFVPTAVVPSIWGLKTAADDLTQGRTHWTSWSLLISAVAIMPLPYSTFDDVNGTMRFLCGLVLALVLYCAYARPFQRQVEGLVQLIRQRD